MIPAVDKREFRDKVKGSRFAHIAALPLRARQAGKHNARVLKNSATWLVRSREHENYTYDLTDGNREHLAWFVAHIAGVPVTEIRTYLDEIESDADLRTHIESLARSSDQRGLADRHVRYGRRIGWYALVRAVKPRHVVETGTDKGLGSCVLAAALLRNGVGRLTTFDIDPAAGYLIDGIYGDVTNLCFGDSVTGIAKLDHVNMFLHDSDHSAAHEAAELAAVAPLLGEDAWVLSDNSHATDELWKWAESTERGFLFFSERPKDHWYPGGGIGVALPLGARQTTTR